MKGWDAWTKKFGNIDNENADRLGQWDTAPILGPNYGKVIEREFFFLTDSSKLSMDTQKLIPVEILT